MPEEYKTIGLCCTTAHKEPVGPILDSLAEGIKAGGKYRILVFQSFDDLYHDTKYNIGAGSVYDVINYDMLDAMIIMPEKILRKSIVDKIVSRCAEHNVPIITIDGGIAGGAYMVTFGYGEAFSQIVEHMMSVHNCRRIKLLAGIRGNDFSQTRIDSCAQVMARYGVELKESDIMYGDFWETPTYAAMDEFFASGEPLPEAFICCNDTMAMAVCLKLNEKGYSVPDDVLVTGFDGIEIEKYHKPRLTTAIRDNDELSEAVIRLLDEICFEGDTAPHDITLNYRPVFSESCGCILHDSMKSNRQLTDFVQSYAYARNFEEHMNSIENNIAADPSPDNAREVIRKQAFEETALCITDEFYRHFSESDIIEEDEPRDGEKSPFDKMRVFVSSFIDKRPIEGAEFSATEILPQLDMSFGDYRMLFILPLHFQDSVIGYYVTPYSPFPHHLERLYTFTMSVDRSLEYMRTHEHLSMLNRRLEFMFTHDHLTRIYNRYGFYKLFKESFERHSVQEQVDVFIVSVDLNDMKYINDNFGHSAGDDALRITANVLTSAAGDDAETICSRFGGDEFVVARICEGDSEQQAERYHANFLRVLEELNDASGKPFRVNASVGVYCASLTAVDSIDGLIELADRLMYNDKARHKRRPRDL